MTVAMFDLLGIGFGPAGISVAAAIQDHIEATGESPVGGFKFLEAGADCQWQKELLLRHADINHSPLRDLVTPRNPRSYYSFANYLKEKGRLYSFGLTGRPVNRIEWSDYVAWAGSHLSAKTEFNTRVMALKPSRRKGDAWMAVRASTSTGVEYEASRLLLSTGTRPNIPEVFQSHLGEEVFHSATFATNIRGIPDPMAVGRVAVVGSGMSAGEIVLDLRERFPNADIHSIHRSHGFRLNDLSHFSSEIYSPEETDYVYSLTADARERVLAESWQTNYSGLDSDGSGELYNTIYLDEVMGRPRVYVEKRMQVTHVEPRAQGVTLHLCDPYSGQSKVLGCDLVVVATGFKVDPMEGPLGDLAEHLVLDEDGRPEVSRAYKVSTKPNFRTQIYLNGQCEHSHGISDAQSFSLLADRAGWILDDMMSEGVETETAALAAAVR